MRSYRSVAARFRPVQKPRLLAAAASATRCDMPAATAAMRQPQAHAEAAQALGSSSGRYWPRKVSSFSGTGEPSHIA
jgi:hypothetical protein